MPKGEDQQRIIGVGEVLWDCFASDRRPGGAPANFTYHAAQFGFPAAIVSRVGQDLLGDELIAFLSERGVETVLLQRDPAHPTGTVTVDTHVAHSPQYTIHDDVAWDFIETDAENLAAVSNAAAVCFGTLAQRHETTRASVHRLLDAAAGAVRIFDVNLRQEWYSGEVIDSSLQRTTVFKLNESEAPAVADLLDLPLRSIEQFSKAIIDRYGLSMVAVTRGAGGCLLVTPGEIVSQPGIEVDVVDTVGAGDAFTAGLAAGMLWKWPVQSVAALANAVGATIASRRGAMPDVRTAYGALRARYAPA